jgi:hypothetical protein
MLHMRSAVIGGVLGSAATFAWMGYIACQKPDNKNSAKAAGSAAPGLPAESSEELGEVIAEIDAF